VFTLPGVAVAEILRNLEAQNKVPRLANERKYVEEYPALDTELPFCR